MVGIDEAARQQLKSLGDFIREQRQNAELSLRDLAARTNVSNPYLSQVERGLHEPSVRVLKAIAGALNMSAETLLVQAGLIEEVATGSPARPLKEEPSTVKAIESDSRLKPEQRAALLAVYRSYVEANEAEAGPTKKKAKAKSA